MVFVGLVKAVTLGVATTLVLLLGAAGADAQTAGKGDKAWAAKQQAVEQKKPDIWVKLCADVPTPDPTKPGEQPKPQKPEEMKKTNVCATQVDVYDNITALPIGKLVIRQIAGQPNPQIMAVLPLQVALPPGVLVKIDDKDPIKLGYVSCNQNGCYAEASIEASFVDQMKTGKQIAYLGIDVRGEAHSVPLPLDGFAKAIDGQPTSLEKYNEDQRKMAEFTKARLAELRKKQEEAAQARQNAQPAAPAQASAKTDKGK